MQPTSHITITKEQLTAASVQTAIDRAHAVQKALDAPHEASVPVLRRVLLNNLFYLPLFALLGATLAWLLFESLFSDAQFLENIEGMAEPFTEEWAYGLGIGVLFDVASGIVVAMMCAGESLSRGKLTRNIGFCLKRGLITVPISFIVTMLVGMAVLVLVVPIPDHLSLDVTEWPVGWYGYVNAISSVSWISTGIVFGLGMYFGVGTRQQLKNAILGGAVGGVVGSIAFAFFEYFLFAHDGTGLPLPRLMAFLATAFGVGLFVALGEQLGRQGWFRVRSGPLAGKSFNLFRQLTSIGSSPNSDIYLFKDASVDPQHGIVHRIGSRYEFESTSERFQSSVNGAPVERCRLVSGDQLMLGATILEFEERARRYSNLTIQEKADRGEGNG
jgi:hypothetical protein